MPTDDRGESTVLHWTDRPADRALAERVLAGDEAAQERFYRDLAPRLRATARSFLGWDDADVEDVVQQTFLAAFQGLPGYDPGRAGLYTWTNQICVHFCLKHFRIRKRLVLTLMEDLETRLPPTPPEVSDRRRTLLGKLQLLGEACRRLVHARFFEDRSYADLAKAEGIPMGTVASRLTRCLHALHLRLSGND